MQGLTRPLLWSSQLSCLHQVTEFLKLGETKDSKSASWGANVILFTSKSDTAPLTKSLASQFEGKIAFGESRASNKALAELFKITRYNHHRSPISFPESTAHRLNPELFTTELYVLQSMNDDKTQMIQSSSSCCST